MKNENETISNLLDYCETDRQKVILQAYIDNGFSKAKAGEALGVNESVVRRAIKMVRKYKENGENGIAKNVVNGANNASKIHKDTFSNMGVETAEVPFYVKSKATLYDADGNVKLEWQKSVMDQVTYHENVKKAISEMMHGFDGKASRVEIPQHCNEDLLTLYPLPDLHIGLLVHGAETNHGYDYDLKTAERWILASMKHLVSCAPKSITAIIIDLGDVLHAADNSARTKSGHQLDVDNRLVKIVQMAFEITRELIEYALTKHEKVIFKSVGGNHSFDSGIYLKGYLSAWFRNDPRVTIDSSHKAQQYEIFGKNILGFTHGHELRPERCSEVMVYDNQANFSDSKYRYFHFGHFHQNKRFESALCAVEIHKNIIPRDMWAESMGFRGNIGEAKCITYHKNYGEIGRNTFNIAMIGE